MRRKMTTFINVSKHKNLQRTFIEGNLDCFEFEVLFDLAILLLGIYLADNYIHVEMTWIILFIVASFVIENN